MAKYCATLAEANDHQAVRAADDLQNDDVNTTYVILVNDTNFSYDDVYIASCQDTKKISVILSRRIATFRD